MRLGSAGKHRITPGRAGIVGNVLSRLSITYDPGSLSEQAWAAHRHHGTGTPAFANLEPLC